MLELNELDFREEGHIYRLNGVIIPSVTTIIEPVSNATYGRIDSFVLAKAASKGTAVHKAIEEYNEFGFVDAEDEYSGYTDAYIKWHESVNPKVLASEIKVYHKLMRYAGTVDMIAEINGEVWLIDHKTSYKAIDKNYRLQLEAYCQALSTHGVIINRKAVLHLHNDGKYNVIEYPLKDAEAWRVFGACKSIYDYNSK